MTDPRSVAAKARGVLLAALLLLVPSSLFAGQRPDLYLVAGRDWRVILPVSVLAGARQQPVPVLLPEEGKQRWFEHFIERYQPVRPAVLVPSLQPEEPLAGSPWSGAPAFDDGGVQAIHLSGSAAELPLLLAETVVPRPPEGEVGPPVWLVCGADYRTGLLAAVAAGAEKGVLLPVDASGDTIEKALGYASSRRSPIRLALAAEGAEALSEAVEAAVEGAKIEVEVVLGPEALTARAVSAFAAGERGGLPAHAVLVNPADTRGWFSPPHLSLLAPLFAISRQAGLVLTEGRPEDLERDLSVFEERHGLVTHVTLLGDYLALRMREMLDPDEIHEGVEDPRSFKIPALAGVTELEPADYAVGRMAAADVHDLSLQIGRALAPRRAFGAVERGALMLANADEIFVMAELASIATVRELENVGWEVSAHYGKAIDRELIFREMPGKELIVWTGHPRDLTVDYDIGVVDQVLDASLVFLQGCYTLDRNDPYVLVQQGAAAIIGTYMAVYSASGSAFAKTVLDAMIYEGVDQGEAMVHARNYLLAYVEMKRQRGHRDWRKTWRAALSFDLWGDPTSRSVSARKTPAKAPARLVRDGRDLRLLVPEQRFVGMSAGRYTLESAAAGQLGSIYTRSDEWGRERRMQPFYFGWIDLPDHETEPKLSSEIPSDEWVTIWVPRRRRLYLLVHNRAEQSGGLDGLVFSLPGEETVAPGEVSAASAPE